MFKNTLLLSSPDVVKPRSQFAVFIAPTSEREDGRDRTRRKSQSAHGALFMVGGFVLSSMGDETLKTAGVTVEARLTGENNHHCVTKRGRFSQKNPLEVETRTTGLVG